MERRKTNGKIYLSFPYNKNFSTKLKHYCGAKWNDKTREWYFDEDFEDKSNELLLEWYGFSYRSNEKIKVELRAWDFYDEEDGKVCINKINIVWLEYRKDGLLLKDGVVIKKGEFSNLNHRWSHIGPNEENADDIVLRVTLSKEFYDSLSDEQKSKMTVISESSEKEKLIAKKEQLLKELEEIEKRLNAIEEEA